MSRFFSTDTATTEIYTLSLHDALPILTAADSRTLNHLRHVSDSAADGALVESGDAQYQGGIAATPQDRKSTRLNSSHLGISYAVFCLKKKKTTKNQIRHYNTI